MNLHYLGMSYDLKSAMPCPWRSSSDPGWKMRSALRRTSGHVFKDFKGLVGVLELGPRARDPQVFNFTSEDPCWNNASITSSEDCSFTPNVVLMQSASDFQAALRQHFKAESRDAFTGSDEYRWLANGSRAHRYVLTEAFCAIYSATLSPTSLPLSEDFILAVEGLPESLDETTRGEYERFLGHWGTHYSVQVTMGARLSRVLELDRSQKLLSSENFRIFQSCLPRNLETMAQADFEQLLKLRQAASRGTEASPKTSQRA